MRKIVVTQRKQISKYFCYFDPKFAAKTSDHIAVLWYIYAYVTPIPLTWKIWRAPNNANKWQMGFNSAFKGLIMS